MNIEIFKIKTNKNNYNENLNKNFKEISYDLNDFNQNNLRIMKNIPNVGQANNKNKPIFEK